MATEIRAVCPNCQSITLKGRVDPKFYYNEEKGVGYCHHCQFKGRMTDDNLDTLNVVDIRTKQPLDVSVWDSLEPLNPEARAYLKRRSIDNPDSFNLRYSKKLHAIAIPTLSEAGAVQGIKYRHIAPINDQRFSAETGSEFGGYWLNGSDEKLLIVEGEIDAMSAKLVGFDGTVLALQTNKLSDSSINSVQKFNHIFTCLDGDKAGAEGTAIIKSLTFNKEVQTIELPEGIKDLNQLLQERGKDESSKFIRLATRTRLEKDSIGLCDSIPKLLTFLSDKRNTSGQTTGWRSINRLLGGGFRNSELTLFVAFAKAGKTSLLNNIVHNLALAGKKVAMASFEMDPETTLFPSLLSIAGETNLRGINDLDRLTREVNSIAKHCDYLNNIITFRRFGYTPWEEVEEWATLMKKKFNIEYLVLDHAGFLTENMTDADENQRLAKNIKALTLTLGIHILCVVQAPKSKDGLSLQTAYGGMAWAQNCDNFFILERDKSDDALLKVRLEAARYPGCNPSNTPAHLYYDRDTGILHEGEDKELN